MHDARLLIVDDDTTHRRLSAELVARHFHLQHEEAADGIQALARLHDAGKPRLDMVLLDHIMPQMDGREVLSHIRRTHPHLPVIMLTGNASIDHAVAFMREGATDYIAKPFNAERMRLTIGPYLKTYGQPTAIDHGFSRLIGSGQGLSRTVHLARKAARATISIHISGESGTGKEMLARAIHCESPRAGRPFVAVNCGAIPEMLAESILFGHEKGSFTGAVRREIGKFREAEGGTLFLDEVAELKPDIQTKLLRAIQEREVQPVGAGKAQSVDVRIISATHRNLAQAVAQGRFREDLYYRLHVFPITIAPLRERRDDIPALVAHLLAQFCLREGRAPVAITKAGMRFLQTQAWPGNVRELENTLYRAAILTQEPLLDAEDFMALALPPIALAGDNAAQAGQSEYAIRLHTTNGQHKTLQQIDDEAIALTLRRCENNVPQTAHLLGMGQSTLYKWLAASAQS